MYHTNFFVLTILILASVATLVLCKKSSPFHAAQVSLEEQVRLRCSLKSTDEVITAWNGTLTASIDGAPFAPIFDIVGVNIARCIKMGDNYVTTQREMQLYLDPVTKQKLTTWLNPFTNENVTVVHVANDPVQFPLYAASYPMPASSLTDSITEFSSTVNLFYPNTLFGNASYVPYSPERMYKAAEYFKFFTETKGLRKKSKKQVKEFTMAWNRVSPFLPFMKMGATRGYLIQAAEAAKIKSIDELPAVLRAELNRNPGYKHAPPCYLNVPNESSWTYFKKHFNSYLAGAEFPLILGETTGQCRQL